ncbi:MAG: hypothetical protein QNJ98_07500 [Planctomycetota bacterium]|nr:hypothetical protein [Planctomycetota bacterium]
MSDVRTAVCTICAKNYVARARTLMASASVHAPTWDRHVLFVDAIDGYIDAADEAFRVWTDHDLGLPDRSRFLFRYALVEANTAVKPWFLERLFEEGYERVLFLDPDTWLLSALPELDAAHDAGAAIVLTPHMVRPLPAGSYPGEAVFLRYGAFNLGFLGLQRSETTPAFLAWWQGHLEHDAIDEPESGHFVDQKWMDLVVGLFPDVHVLRNEGYNVAHWNIAARDVRDAGDGALRSNDMPLRLFHFSAFDPSEPEILTRTGLERSPLPATGALRGLCRRYADALGANGEATVQAWPYAYATTADGVPLPRCIRRMARGEGVSELGDDPFARDAAWFNEPCAPETEAGVPYTRAMHALWCDLSALQWLHRDARGEGRVAYARWFVRHAPENGVAEAFIEPVREALRRKRRRGRRLFSRDPR